MVRLIFISVIVLHGLLHLIGFAKEWSFATKGLTQKNLVDFWANTSKVAGMFWLFTCMLFNGAAILYLVRWEAYWLFAGTALLMSQTLIFIYWQDAKYGTIVNAVILVALIFTAPAMGYEKMVAREIDALMESASTGKIKITENNISNLPPNVQRWMRQSNVVGTENPNVIRVFQQGSMRSKPGGKWMPFEAEQYFSINPPSFVWTAKINVAPFLPTVARDRFRDGKGNMLIKPVYLYTAANSSGDEINQGTLLRFMAEMSWFPQAAVSDYLHWENISDQLARVTMNYGESSASGIYHFNEDGNFSGFEAQRFGDFNGVFRKEKWSISVKGYKTFNNKVIPNVSEVTWKLKEGDFQWLKIEVKEIK